MHIAPPVILGFSAAPNLSDLTRSKHGTPWHGFRHISLFPYRIWQRERLCDAVFPPLHHTRSSLEKLVFFRMANATFPVNTLKFWLVLPPTAMPVGKARRPSPSICVMLGRWDPTLPPVCPTASSATPRRPLTPLQGCRASWIYVLTPTATEGHHFNQGSGRDLTGRCFHHKLDVQ